MTVRAEKGYAALELQPWLAYPCRIFVTEAIKALTLVWTCPHLKVT